MFPDDHPEVLRDIAARVARPARGRPMDWDFLSKLLGSYVVCPKCGVLNQQRFPFNPYWVSPPHTYDKNRRIHNIWW